LIKSAAAFGALPEGILGVGGEAAVHVAKIADARQELVVRRREGKTNVNAAMLHYTRDERTKAEVQANAFSLATDANLAVENVALFHRWLETEFLFTTAATSAVAEATENVGHLAEASSHQVAQERATEAGFQVPNFRQSCGHGRSLYFNDIVRVVVSLLRRKTIAGCAPSRNADAIVVSKSFDALTQTHFALAV